jgi:ubiquinone/menaquinone biosynthesis C-methylase UbiE
MTTSRKISIEAAVVWSSAHAAHTDRQLFEGTNLWRDFFPGDLGEQLQRAAVGDSVRASFRAGELVVDLYDRAGVRRLRATQFVGRLPGGEPLTAQAGRFYPRTFLRDVPDFFSGDRRPFRCLALDAQGLTVDLNHPFAAFDASVEATVVEDLGMDAERGGRAHDLAQSLTERGPGMQAALPDRDTDFFYPQAFTRIDPRPDTQFYREPRFVQHLDTQATARIRGIYARFLKPGMRVLDVMSSWVSHLPEGVDELSVTGIGLNAAELERNARLSARVVHDLNVDARLPFAAGEFDVALCTASVEYLVEPVAVFRELARVLQPGAPLVMTFSDRWFPTKAIALWGELHAFERMALVSDYFRKSGGFTDLATESIRGLPRPPDDKYAGQLPNADPVFAVWGRRAP